jgi:hypothetical protein
MLGLLHFHMNLSISTKKAEKAAGILVKICQSFNKCLPQFHVLKVRYAVRRCNGPSGSRVLLGGP